MQISTQKTISPGSIAKYVGQKHHLLFGYRVLVGGHVLDSSNKPTSNFQVFPYLESTNNYSILPYDARTDELRPVS